MAPSDFGLDMVALAPRVQVMRRPWKRDTNFEVHRNNVDQVREFLDKEFPKHYQVFSLEGLGVSCGRSEPTSRLLQISEFHNQALVFCMAGAVNHPLRPPPPLPLLCGLCSSVRYWLEFDRKLNTCVLQVADVGPAVLLSLCSILLAIDAVGDKEEAVKRLQEQCHGTGPGAKRTSTIPFTDSTAWPPSIQRYLGYMEALVAGKCPRAGPSNRADPPKFHIKLLILSGFVMDFGTVDDLSIEVFEAHYDDELKTFDYRMVMSNSGYEVQDKDVDKGEALLNLCPRGRSPLWVQGDVAVRLSIGGHSCRFFFHTSFITAGKSDYLQLKRPAFDVDKDVWWPDSLAVNIVLDHQPPRPQLMEEDEEDDQSPASRLSSKAMSMMSMTSMDRGLLLPISQPSADSQLFSQYHAVEPDPLLIRDLVETVGFPEEAAVVAAQVSQNNLNEAFDLLTRYFPLPPQGSHWATWVLSAQPFAPTPSTPHSELEHSDVAGETCGPDANDPVPSIVALGLTLELPGERKSPCDSLSTASRSHSTHLDNPNDIGTPFQKFRQTSGQPLLLPPTPTPKKSQVTAVDVQMNAAPNAALLTPLPSATKRKKISDRRSAPAMRGQPFRASQDSADHAVLGGSSATNDQPPDTQGPSDSQGEDSRTVKASLQKHGYVPGYVIPSCPAPPGHAVRPVEKSDASTGLSQGEALRRAKSYEPGEAPSDAPDSAESADGDEGQPAAKGKAAPPKGKGKGKAGKGEKTGDEGEVSAGDAPTADDDPESAATAGGNEGQPAAKGKGAPPIGKGKGKTGKGGKKGEEGEVSAGDAPTDTPGTSATAEGNEEPAAKAKGAPPKGKGKCPPLPGKGATSAEGAVPSAPGGKGKAAGKGPGDAPPPKAKGTGKEDGPAAKGKGKAPPTVLPLGRKLHWKEISERNLVNTVWAEIGNQGEEAEEEAEAAETLGPDGLPVEVLEKLFKTTGGAAQAQAKAKSAQTVQQTLLDHKRAQNIGIILASLGIGTDELAQRLQVLKIEGLTLDTLEKCPEVLPNDEEVEKFKAFRDPLSTLRDVEQRIYPFCLLSRPAERLKLMTFGLKLPQMVADQRQEIGTVVGAVQQVRSSKRLRSILKTVLVLGNFVNHAATGSAGPTKGFSIEALPKLAEMKSPSVPSVNMLHYVAYRILGPLQRPDPREQAGDGQRRQSVCESRGPDGVALVELKEELSLVAAASRVKATEVQKSLDELQKEINSVVCELKYEKMYEPEAFQAIQELRAKAERELDELKASFSECERQCQEMLHFFGEDSQRKPAADFFSVLQSFVEVFSAAVGDLLRQPKKFELLLQTGSATPTKGKEGMQRMRRNTIMPIRNPVAEDTPQPKAPRPSAPMPRPPGSSAAARRSSLPVASLPPGGFRPLEGEDGEGPKDKDSGKSKVLRAFTAIEVLSPTQEAAEEAKGKPLSATA